MEYKARPHSKNHNISETSASKEFLLLTLGLGGILLAFFFALGLLVDTAVDWLTPEQEAQIYSIQIPSLFEQEEKYPEQTQQLQLRIDKLKQCLDIQYPIEVHLIEDDSINAMAYPGGHIIVFTGLLQQLNTENGLNFVLAHELGHFKNKDHLRSLGRGIVITAVSTLLVGSNAEITQVLAPGTQLGMAQYSQKRESEVDKLALTALNCMYGHTGGADELFRVLKDEQVELVPLHYFSSHPELNKRIAALKLAKHSEPLIPLSEALTIPTSENKAPKNPQE